MTASQRDAIEAGGEVGRVQATVLDDEDVLARALRHVALGIEQQGLVVAVGGDFLVGQDGVDVVAAGLGAHQRHVDVVARERGGLHADAARDAIFAEVGAPGPDRDRAVDGVALGRHAHLLGADPGDRTDVAGIELVQAHAVFLRLHQLLGGVRDPHLEDLGRVEEALRVLGKPEDRGARRRLVGAYPLEDRHAVVQRVGQHVQFRVAPIDHLAVEPDQSVAVGHRHGEAPVVGIRRNPRVYRNGGRAPSLRPSREA